MAHDFDGAGLALNGVDVVAGGGLFAPGIVAAGGASQWVAAAGFADDGSIDVNRNAAYLDVGSYLDDAKGTAAGKFELTATISETGGEWVSLGFSTLSSPSTGFGMANEAVSGFATIIYRGSGELDMFVGPGAAGNKDGPDGLSGTRTFSVTLDFTPAGGYDGVAHFGTVTWTVSDLGVGSNLGTAFPLPNESVRSILISGAAASTGMISSLALRQLSAGPDTTSPILTATEPPAGANTVVPDTDLMLVFNEAVQLGNGEIKIRSAADRSLVEAIDVTTPGAAVVEGTTVLRGVGSEDKKRFFALAEKHPPNIVLIMADDLGYGSLGSYGNQQIHTPNLDFLAANGLRFTDFHSNGPMCSPTRAALMTGRYQQRAAWVPDEELSPVFREQRRNNLKQRWAWGISLDEVTIADVLKSAGYHTGMVGKWHLGYDFQFHPMYQGFDEFRGFVGGAVDYYTHIALYGLQQLDWWNGLSIENDQGYATDLLTDYATGFITRNKDTPFFLYLPHGAPHTPIQGRDPDSTQSVADVYKEMIEVLDESVGSILNTLQQHNLVENTLLIFCSDNGPEVSYYSSAGPLRGMKGSMYEGGHRVPCIAYWPGVVPCGGVSDEPLMTMDFFPTFAGLAGATPPNDLQLDGVDMLPVLRGDAGLEDRTLHWFFDNAWAVRQGPWKLIGQGDSPSMLVNLDSDLGESQNQLASHPQLAGELLSLHQDWYDEVRIEIPRVKVQVQH